MTQWEKRTGYTATPEAKEAVDQILQALFRRIKAQITVTQAALLESSTAAVKLCTEMANTPEFFTAKTLSMNVEDAIARGAAATKMEKTIDRALPSLVSYQSLARLLQENDVPRSSSIDSQTLSSLQTFALYYGSAEAAVNLIPEFKSMLPVLRTMRELALQKDISAFASMRYAPQHHTIRGFTSSATPINNVLRKVAATTKDEKKQTYYDDLALDQLITVNVHRIV